MIRNNRYKGTTKRGNKWQAKIMINGELTHLGYFDTPEAAHWAYLRALRDSNLVEGPSRELWQDLGDPATTLWNAEIKFNGRTVSLGKFETKQEAYDAFMFVLGTGLVRGHNKNTPYTGVTREGDACKWRAQLSMYGKSTYLGAFDTAKAAHKAYVRAARKRGRDVIDETQPTQEQDS